MWLDDFNEDIKLRAWMQRRAGHAAQRGA